MKGDKITVTLYQDGNSGPVSAITYYEKEGVPASVAVPSKTGYAFEGYFTGVESGNLFFDRDGMRVSDVTPPDRLFARWRAVMLALTLVVGGNRQELEVPYGQSLEKSIEGITYNGLYAKGWSKTEGGARFTGTITADVTLYALGLAPGIVFDANGGGAVAPVVGDAGSALLLPTPFRQGAEFDGWYNGNTKFESDVMPASSIKLTARWAVVITLEANGGDGLAAASLRGEPGKAMSLPTLSRAGGFAFAGWYNGASRYTTAVFPAAGMTLTAKYTASAPVSLRCVTTEGQESKAGFTWRYEHLDTDDKAKFNILKANPSIPIQIALQFEYRGGALLSTTTVKLVGSSAGDVFFSKGYAPASSYTAASSTASSTAARITTGERIFNCTIDNSNWNSTVYIRNITITVTFIDTVTLY
ncbi:MAG: InlB B-repeat-containing protein [Clostridiales bacterium]|nr:InlB B-repeat-containing protein [Clostridiales bacterium]